MNVAGFIRLIAAIWSGAGAIVLFGWTTWGFHRGIAGGFGCLCFSLMAWQLAEWLES